MVTDDLVRAGGVVTTVDAPGWAEFVAQRFEGKTVRYTTPGDLAQAIDARTVQTPMLDLVDELCVDVVKNALHKSAVSGPRKMIFTPPQEGKSQRLSKWFPLWALLQDPTLRIAIASYEATTARRWGRAIRDLIVDNPDLGLRISRGKSSQNDWEIAGHGGGVYTVGVGGSLTGRPVDLLIIDDPVKDRAEADSEVNQQKVWDWWTDTAKTRLAPGAPVVLIMTRWHPKDLAGRLLESDEEHWDVLSVPARCEDPETDPLGREKGEYMVSSRGRTQAQWEAIEASSTLRTWFALYQQRPTPAAGLVFQRPWIDRNRRASGDGEHTFVRRIVSVDPAATSKESSDETGIIVLALDYSGHAWVLDDRSLRGTPEQWGHAVWTAFQDWQCDEIVVEDNQGGEMTLSSLSATWQTFSKGRGGVALQPRVTPVHATSSKRVRAESVATLYEINKVHHANDGTQRLKTLEDQMVTWTGTGASPDRMDALVHGLRALATPRPEHQSRSTRTR